MKDISNYALLALVAFMIIPIFISYREKLGLSKEVIYSSLRGFVQLMVIGYALTFIFSIQTPIVIIGIILVMITIASRNAAKRGSSFARPALIVFTALTGAIAIVLTMWVVFGVIEFKAQYAIPMCGMIIGNSMVVASLTFERLKNEFDKTKDMILQKLALGATDRQASQDMIETTVKAAMIPTVDSLKTIGLVHLPGMMSGAIVAGADPVVAVKYQIVILFSVMTSATASAMIVSFMTYRQFYRRKMFK